jgi:glycosyltransferase involved in cell wall biosynthesis
MRRPSVVVINDFAYANGGASQVALSSAMGLAKDGYDVRLLVGALPTAGEVIDSTIPVVSTGQQEIARARPRISAAVNGIWNVRAARLCRQLLAGMDRTRTVVHVHGWTKVLSSSVIAESVNSGFVVTCTLHDYFSICPNGGLFNFQTGEPCHIDPMSLRCMTTHCDSRRYSHKLWRTLRQGVQSTAGKFPAGIEDFIAVSEFSRSILIRQLGKHARVHIVHNPVSVARDERVPAARNSNFVYVGRLAREKGPLIFARAAKQIGAVPVFVGDGELREAVLRECPESVITGWVPPATVAGFLRNARALIFPSLWYETQGLAVMEALARGIPAVVPRGTAAAEFVSAGETGMLFTRGDASDLAAKLRALCDEALVARLGTNAYERYWSAPLDLNAHVAALAEVYERLLRRSNARFLAT